MSARRSWATCCEAHIPSQSLGRGYLGRVERPSDSHFVSERRSGSRWGVELEFTRPRRNRNGFQRCDPFGEQSRGSITWSPRVPGSITMPQLFPTPFLTACSTTQRHNTLSTTVWINQNLSPRISLVYLAGMGFYRTTYESESRFDILPPEHLITGRFPALIEDSHLRRQTARGVRGPHRPDRSRRPRARAYDCTASRAAWLLRPAVGLAWNF